MYGADDPNNPFSTSITEQTKYTYDAFNRLIGRTNDATGTREIYVYDGNQIVLRFVVNGTTSTASAGNLKDRYVWGPAVDQLLADEKVTSLTSAGVVDWPLADYQNTVRDVAEYNSGTGVTSVADHNTYDAYGYKISQSNAAHDVLFAYTGRYLDVRDRFQFNGNRWYDTTTRRWLSEDPLGLAAGPNLEEYCGDSPTNGTDPTGTQTCVYTGQSPGMYWINPNTGHAVPVPPTGMGVFSPETFRGGGPLSPIGAWKYAFDHSPTAKAAAVVGVGAGVLAGGFAFAGFFAPSGISPLEAEAVDVANDLIAQRAILARNAAAYSAALAGGLEDAGDLPNVLDMAGGLYNNVLAKQEVLRGVLDNILDSIIPPAP